MNTPTTDQQTVRVLYPVLGGLRPLSLTPSQIGWYRPIAGRDGAPAAVSPKLLREKRQPGDVPYLRPWAIPYDLKARRWAPRVFLLSDLLAEASAGAGCWFCGEPIAEDDLVTQHPAAAAHKSCALFGRGLRIEEQLIVRNLIRSLPKNGSKAEGAPEKLDGQITRDRVRWCSACGTEHGASFVCPKAPAQVQEMAQTYEPPPLHEGQHGCGISQVLAPFAGGAR